jgi:hypothetical protein
VDPVVLATMEVRASVLEGPEVPVVRAVPVDPVDPVVLATMADRASVRAVLAGQVVPVARVTMADRASVLAVRVVPAVRMTTEWVGRLLMKSRRPT